MANFTELWKHKRHKWFAWLCVVLKFVFFFFKFGNRLLIMFVIFDANVLSALKHSMNAVMEWRCIAFYSFHAVVVAVAF